MQPPFDIPADLDTPVSAYLKLRPFRPRFLLESVEGGERLARYSWIGFGDRLEVRLDQAGLHVQAPGEARTTRPRPADQAALLAALRAELARAPRPLPEIPGMPLAGGLVGAASYDLVRYFERLPTRLPIDSHVPDACYLAPRSFLVFDHVTRGIALLHAGPDDERADLRREIVRALRGGLTSGRPPARLGPATPSLSRDEYIAGVRRAQEHIAAGDVYQLVLSTRFEGECELDAFEAYRALRLINPSPYMIYCELGDQTLVGSSPEALVRLNGRAAQLRPIAGTRSRGENPEADRILERELLADHKENAEHAMLVQGGTLPASVPGVLRFEPMNGSTKLVLEREARPASVLRALLDAGVAVESYTPAEPPLEDIFVHVVTNGIGLDQGMSGTPTLDDAPRMGGVS